MDILCPQQSFNALDSGEGFFSCSNHLKLNWESYYHETCPELSVLVMKILEYAKEAFLQSNSSQSVVPQGQ